MWGGYLGAHPADLDVKHRSLKLALTTRSKSETIVLLWSDEFSAIYRDCSLSLLHCTKPGHKNNINSSEVFHLFTLLYSHPNEIRRNNFCRFDCTAYSSSHRKPSLWKWSHHKSYGVPKHCTPWAKGDNPLEIPTWIESSCTLNFHRPFDRNGPCSSYTRFVVSGCKIIFAVSFNLSSNHKIENIIEQCRFNRSSQWVPFTKKSSKCIIQPYIW